MATPTSNGNYSLAALNWCAGSFNDKDGSANDNRKLAAGANGSASTDTKMSDFMIDGFTAPGAVSAGSSSGSATFSCGFTNAETRFTNRTRSKTKSGTTTEGPFYWAESGSILTIAGGNGWGGDDYNANISWNNTGQSQTTAYYNVGFRDHYNKAATNYTTADSDILQTSIIIPAAEGGGRGGDGGGEDPGGGRR